MRINDCLVITVLLLWIGILLPFDPNKKNVIYNGSIITRITCLLVGVCGAVVTFTYYLISKNSGDLKIISDVSIVTAIALVICSIMCFKELLARKNHGIVFIFVSVVALALILLDILWLILYSEGALYYDIYLFMVPAIGSILMSAHGSKYNN